MTWSKWSANLKVFLEELYNSLIQSPLSWDIVKSKIKAPRGSAKNLVSAKFKTISTRYSKKVRMTTFHDIKGESLDAALVVSSNRKGKGGHVKEWMSADVQEQEYTRFAYVASSRPRHLLIWAVPKLDDKLRGEIIKLGFKIG